MSPDEKQVLVHWYRTMLLIRRFEERIEKLFAEGIVRGTSHLSIGQEAVAAGVCAAIRPDDYIVSTHRGHGHFLAKDGDPKLALAEIFGKRPGYSGGRGGSQHMACFELGFLGSNGITGGGIPIAVGAALALQYQKRPQIVVSFFGEGATNQGTFHEALNLAAIWRLPVIFVCENNSYAMSTPFREAFAIDHIEERAPAYGIPGTILDGNDFFEVRDAIGDIAEYTRQGNGPSLVECKTYRLCGHSRGDPRIYRDRAEEKDWAARCPVKRLERILRNRGVLDDARAEEIEAEVGRQIDEAEKFARSAPDPDPATLLDGLFA